jgi:LmbE family N-acetylglucosaminyl deacetylase
MRGKNACKGNARFQVGVLCLAMYLATGSAGAAKTLVVFAPHPDDEGLMASGIIYSALQRGDTVEVVLMTNGDACCGGGPAVGLTRESETVTAMAKLGLSEENVIFLGYGDQALMPMYSSTSPTAIFTSQAGQTQTYADRGLGGVSYHEYLYGVPGAYSQATLVGDVEAVLQNFGPDEVYTTNSYDSHPDHAATCLFVAEAILALRSSGAGFRPKLYTSIIHDPFTNYQGGPGYWPWPPFAPDSPISPPTHLGSTPLDWNEVVNFPVPAVMQIADQAANLKEQAISAYVTQGAYDPSNWLFSFVKKNEFFWLTDYSADLALSASVTDSSETANHTGEKAIDGVVDGAPNNSSQEWVSAGQLAGAWIQLNWAEPVTTSLIVLHDRPNSTDNIQAGTLSFSDGSSVPVAALANSGAGIFVTFSPRSISWVRFTVDQAVGSSAGLAEIEVYGTSASNPSFPPRIIWGPVATPTVINDTQTSALSVTGYSANGSALQYSWSTDIGSIVGNGPTAVFTPPSSFAGSMSVATITVTVADSSGGTVSNSTFVTGTAQTGTNVALSATATCSSQNQSTGQLCAKAIDGVIDGYPGDYTKEWATVGQLAGAWITLTWSSPVSVSEVVLYDRPNLTDNVTSGTLTFSDGSSISVGQLPNDGTGYPVTFAAKTITWVKFTVDTAVGQNIGLSEFQVFAAGGGTTGPAVSSLSLSPSAVVGGGSSTGTVTLTLAAPSGGAAVTLTSSNATVATVPASVTVSEGLTSATFTVSTSPVTATTSVTISATYNGQTQTATLTVNPEPATGTNVAPNATATCSSQNQSTGQLCAKAIDGVIDGYPGDYTKEWATVGQLAGAWITLTWSSPVSVSEVVLYDRPNLTDNVTSGTLTFSDGSSISVGQLPNDGTGYPVTFAAKTITWVKFTVDTAVGQNIGLSEFQVLAAGGGTTGPAVSSLSLSPSAVVGGGSSTGTVTLTLAAPSGGAAVTLTSSNATVATVPASVTVSEGSTSATFAVSTSPVTATTSVTISATYNGQTQTATLTVLAALNLSSVTLSPTTVVGGATSQGTVTLNAAAPTGGAAVTLSSSNPSVASVATSVVVVAGQTSASFSVQTSSVNSQTPVTISASYSGMTLQASLSVISYAVSSSNLARGATVTVSSETPSTGQLGVKAIDGVADGYPGDYTKEWATQGQLAGAWIELDWSTPVLVSQVVLCDRPNLVDNVTSGTLSFSDGTTIPVGALPNDGTPLPVSFSAKTITSLKFTADTAVGSNIGLSEIQVFSSPYAGTFTQHNDAARSGENVAEMALTPSNVDTAQFGKLFSLPVDGYVYAQPLYVKDLLMPDKTFHNIVIAATEHDSVFAFDADSGSSTPLWRASFINPSADITSVPSGEVNTSALGPEIGITATPVIDPSTNTLYVAAMTKENGSCVWRLHALDITSGAEKSGSPVVISGTVAGTGAGTDGQGNVAFSPQYQNNHAGLLLANGIVYVAFGSFSNSGPYHGWVFAYNAVTLSCLAIFNTTPNGTGGGIWQGGGGIAADSWGNIFVVTSQGTFDANAGGVDYAQSVLKLQLQGNALAVADSFTPYNQAALTQTQQDLGAGGALILSDQGGAYPHLLALAGQGGTLYLINGDNLGKFQAGSDGQIVQSLISEFPIGATTGVFGSGGYWGGQVFLQAENDYLRAFTLLNGLLSIPPLTGPSLFGPKGASPSVSSNGSFDGIVWVLQTDAYGTQGPAVLHAYNAANVGTELYNSSQSGTRDQAGAAVEFAVPTVANGRVFIGTQGTIDVYGLFD